jgi:hypothetical protein
MATQKITHEIITAAIDGFEAQKKRIDAQIADLRQALTGNGVRGVAASEPVRGRRKMSAAARKRIGDAQRKRWAAARRESGVEARSEPEARMPKRRISAAGRKAIVEATRKRWAAYRAQQARAKKASAKR